ncbi:putative Mg2+ transporter-C (MgtC) family protein [Proteiniborus ethanoligenes]|uniref:Putative Mg2+ transporter-C (MgtC) family protein n=1 Tax=Proteiniborus ethanoligenes TaxID=415015 RepID=A0A1H3PSQ0_9FIRM|nr:MgtC/SapB family protein [Proteiniborus ethanoligenes]SDZ03905.1 putative Mg2+ transporter-C (MgtC) family protein [Proteiniborus ethanoligenes]
MISNGEVILRLVLSALAGGIVGMEREANHSSAGLRTHILVTLGSTLIMLISMYGFQGLGANNNGGEPARLAAQVVSGIGFLGAGTILRTGNNIRGLTTAASIWVCGGIGLAIGNGYYIGGIATTIIVLFTLRGLVFIQNKLSKGPNKLLIVHCKERAGLIGDIGHILGKNNIIINEIKVNSEDNIVENGDYLIEIRFTVKLPSKFLSRSFFDEILSVNGVENAIWEGDLEKAF